jgi:arsenical pump membrane protein
VTTPEHPTATAARSRRNGRPWAGRALFLIGVAGVGVALSLNAGRTGSAASQVWSPFVLVAGLLLVGLVADADGLFLAAGRALGRLAPNTVALFAGASVLVAVVTAVLNLDTSVVFLTPVLVHAARGRGRGEAALLYGCLLLSNAASLLLPGSNLTNLIVAGHLHFSGAAFFDRMAPAWICAVLVTAIVVGIMERRSLRAGTEADGFVGDPTVGNGAGGFPVVGEGAIVDAPAQTPAAPAAFGLGLVAVVAVAVFVVVLRSPAVPVAAVGLLVVGIRVAGGSEHRDRVLGVLGLPVLVGLFGIAVTLGTLGRSWSGPAAVLAHLDAWGTAAGAALASVLVNNLPAASLLASRVPPRPYALLIGLDVGPNLFVTGSLAWILWLQAARRAGARPSIRRASVLGLVSVPLSMAAALGVLSLTGSH